MPGWLKALLAVAIIIVLLVVVVVVGGVVWFSRNKDKLMGRAKEVMTEGRDFGRSTDNSSRSALSLTHLSRTVAAAKCDSRFLSIDYDQIARG